MPRIVPSKNNYLEQEDECYFYKELNDLNDLINNFKKPPERQNKPEWKYKQEAIEEVAQILLNRKDWEQLQGYTWIPIPPSKAKDDPCHDNRLLVTLKFVKKVCPDLDVRELVVIKSSRKAAHELESGERPSPAEHYNNFQIKESALLQPKPKGIVIFDDVITYGSSFKAMQRLLREKYGSVKIIGIFIACTMPNTD